MWPGAPAPRNPPRIPTLFEMCIASPSVAPATVAGVSAEYLRVRLLLHAVMNEFGFSEPTNHGIFLIGFVATNEWRLSWERNLLRMCSKWGVAP